MYSSRSGYAFKIGKNTAGGLKNDLQLTLTLTYG